MGRDPNISPRHILLLTDRDWTHPQGGGTGTNLYGQVARWLAWGHRVTVIAGAYDGCEPVSRPSDQLTIHRMGSRLTVFPRAARATKKGIAADADVCLEVINGISFFTPLWWWLKMPRVALVHHVHQDHYIAELGRRGRIAAWLLEYMPLRMLYPGIPVITISEAARDDLVEKLGIAPDLVHVAYLGVEPSQFREPARAEQPTLLYLGRLKQYKRIEVALDVLEGIPEARLEIAGTGEWQEVIEKEIAQRGLGDRVRMHGFVAEEAKSELYASAWLNLTASSAEGWCLTVMEAAACGTPSAALRVGGLAESIVDGETGILADEPDELTAAVRDLVHDRARLEMLGRQAQDRAHEFTWERAAASNLEVLEHAADRPRVSLVGGLVKSDGVQAGGLAAATLVSNAVQLVFTVIFTRILGGTGYGSLAALVSAFLILLVGGQALQVAAARETALHQLGDGPGLTATVNAWTRSLLVTLFVVTGLCILLRHPLGHLTGVPEYPYAAAAILPTGVLWLLVSVQRGVLQGLRDYVPVGASLIGEALGRLVFGLILVAVGFGVTGAFLGTPLALVVIAIALSYEIHRRVGAAGDESSRRALRTLVSGAWVPILALGLMALMQNIDIIVVKHQVGGAAAGSYAAAAVAAKAVVWVAIGVALHLLPEATRRAAQGQDAIPVLMRSFGVLAIIAIPALLLFTFFPEQLLSAAFGPSLTQASGALPVLGLAMTLLAIAYLIVQYMLALGRTSFLWVLGVIALMEPFLLAGVSGSLTSYAAVVLGLQVAAVVGLFALVWRARNRVLTPASAL